MLDRVIFRVDVGADVGIGHFMRCVALGQGFKKRGIQPLFVINDLPSSIGEICKKEEFLVKSISHTTGSKNDGKNLIQICKEINPQLIVVDGYRFGLDYLKFIKENGIKILFIDDLGSDSTIPSDFILNQNISAKESMYQNNTSVSKLFLGNDFVLIRREFLDRKFLKRNLSNTKDLLITLGGSDQENVTMLVLQSMDKKFFDLFNITVVLGPMNVHYDKINRKFGKNSNIDIQCNVTNMAELISNSDLVLTVPGVTIWEILFFAIPTITITISENQKNNAIELEKKGAIISLGNYSKLTPKSLNESLMMLIDSEDRRKELSYKAGKVVDGLGVERIITKVMA